MNSTATFAVTPPNTSVTTVSSGSHTLTSPSDQEKILVWDELVSPENIKSLTLRANITPAIASLDGFSNGRKVSLKIQPIVKTNLPADIECLTAKSPQTKNPEHLKRFENEVCQLVRIRMLKDRCTNIINILGYFSHSNIQVMFLPFFPYTLDSALSTQHHSVAGYRLTDIPNISAQLASAIHYLHTKAQLLHNAIRPGNILLKRFNPGQQFHLVLAGFDQAGSISGALCSDLSTQDKNLYAPELVENKPATFYSDTYDFGRVMLAMFTGRSDITTWYINSQNQFINTTDHMNLRALHPETIRNPDLPEAKVFIELFTLMKSCLVLFPRQRPDSAVIKARTSAIQDAEEPMDTQPHLDLEPEPMDVT